MGTKSKYTSIKTRLSLFFFIGFIVAAIAFVMLLWLSELLIDDFFLHSTYMQEQEKKYVDSLQAYVIENNVEATDIIRLRKWERKNDINIFSVTRERVLIYDNTYAGDAPIFGADTILVHKNWQYLYTVEFADGPADVYIDKNFKRELYLIAMIASAAISAIIWTTFMVVAINSRIRYIRLLKTEIDKNKNDNRVDYTINGNDELTELAGALNNMQSELKAGKERELLQKKEHETLVLGMAHDLRTPLTGLMGYLELCKISTENPQELDAYLTRAVDKINQIRDLSDKLFDHFLSNNGNSCNLEAPANASYLLGDYLSDFCAQSEACGFNINIDSLEWYDAVIQTDSDFVSRILNNILSNIEKYASKAQPVILSSSKSEHYFEISISNHTAGNTEIIQGTHIGTENIDKMMKLMHGHTIITNKDNLYCITLLFKLL